MVDAFTTAALPRLLHAGWYDADGSCPMHGHAGLEILLVRRGSCTLEVAGRSFPAGPGSLFVLPPRTDHRHVDRGRVATTYLVLRTPPRAFAGHLRHLRLAADEPLAPWIEQLAVLHRYGPRDGGAVIGPLLLAVLARIAQLERRTAPRLPPPLLRAIAHLERDLLTPTTPAALAAVAGVSASHLQALFRDHLGCPPLRWQRRKRIDLACRLLREHAMPVAEIARACGWEDANHFGRVFRAEIGVAPGAWRARPANR